MGRYSESPSCTSVIPCSASGSGVGGASVACPAGPRLAGARPGPAHVGAAAGLGRRPRLPLLQHSQVLLARGHLAPQQIVGVVGRNARREEQFEEKVEADVPDAVHRLIEPAPELSLALGRDVVYATRRPVALDLRGAADVAQPFEPLELRVQQAHRDLTHHPQVAFGAEVRGDLVAVARSQEDQPQHRVLGRREAGWWHGGSPRLIRRRGLLCRGRERLATVVRRRIERGRLARREGDDAGGNRRRAEADPASLRCQSPGCTPASFSPAGTAMSSCTRPRRLPAIGAYSGVPSSQPSASPAATTSPIVRSVRHRPAHAARTYSSARLPGARDRGAWGRAVPSVMICPRSGPGQVSTTKSTCSPARRSGPRPTTSAASPRWRSDGSPRRMRASTTSAGLTAATSGASGPT